MVELWRFSCQAMGRFGCGTRKRPLRSQTSHIHTLIEVDMLNPHILRTSNKQASERVYDERDRGPAEFFHGCEDLGAHLGKVPANACGKNAGTTFLI
ncbi:MAG: hypothetical protein OXF06_01760 [Bacteroidetes bacterium]|nr:hypothetical protein [Bacteroidota bacterium]